ncbi:O-methyltransferase [Gluconobacter sphaericus]|uniref:O-methyltransferase n=1 Tax=Gluconobacter sphaericus TaxID=574987 RepID=UPI00312B89CB
MTKKRQSSKGFAYRLTVLDPVAQRVIDTLITTANAQKAQLLKRYLPQLPALLMGRSINFKEKMSFYDDKLLPIDREQGELLYMLLRSRGVQCAVEFGTSFGVSSIYLAAAIRDSQTGGRLIGTEMVTAKVVSARANIAAAGLSAYAEVREGDARLTLLNLACEVDFLLLDGWPTLAMDILRLVEPKLSNNAIVVLDNVGHFRGNLRSLTNYLKEDRRYIVSELPLHGGMIIAIFKKLCSQL